MMNIKYFKMAYTKSTLLNSYSRNFHYTPFIIKKDQLNDMVDFHSNALSSFEASKAFQKQKHADAFRGRSTGVAAFYYNYFSE